VIKGDKSDIASQVIAFDTTDSVKNIEQRFAFHGPFYITKHRRIYRVETQRHVYWFRYGGWFGTDIYREVDGNYEKVKGD
jgi:hypothetical protein